MVHTFQENFRTSMLSYLKLNLPKTYALQAKIQNKSSHILFLLSGLNNRLYFKKTYYFYENGIEKNHRFAGYFLQQYQPFSGELPWNKKERSEPRLITYINEPVAQPDCMENLPNNLRLMMPLNQATFYWSMAAHSLYDDVSSLIKLFTPNLVMVDLANARLGINEGDDDGDSWSASHGDELIQVLEAMKPCCDLQHLNLSGNYIVQDGVLKQLPVFFAPLSKLTFLSLAEALPHSQGDLNSVGQSLLAVPNLTYLDLSRNSLNSDMFDNLTQGINGLSRLKTLDLSQNRLSIGYDLEEDYKGGAEEGTAETLSWVCNFIHTTSTLKELDITDNDFDSLSFDWGEIADNAGISKKELKAVYKKLLIEKDAGDYLSDSSESTNSTSSEESSEEEEDEDS